MTIEPVSALILGVSFACGPKFAEKVFDRVWKRTFDTDIITRQELEDKCKECKKEKTHDEDSRKQEITKIHEKVNCVDRKVAKLVGAFEARGWLAKESSQ
jgi:hypothetical protein